MNEKMDGLSMNLEQANLDKLRSVFPGVRQRRQAGY